MLFCEAHGKVTPWNKGRLSPTVGTQSGRKVTLYLDRESSVTLVKQCKSLSSQAAGLSKAQPPCPCLTSLAHRLWIEDHRPWP